MGSFLALISLGLLVLSTLFTDGSSRYFKVTPNTGEAPLQVTFTANELYGSKQAEKFIWVLGNGETITTTNPRLVYTYNTPGTFTANLKYLKKNTDSISKAKDGGSVKIIVREKPNTAPIANFSCEKVGVQKIRCESSSSDKENNITGIAWTLDDGSTYTTHSFEHTFKRPEDVAISTHNVSLVVTDELGLSDSIAKNIEVDLETIKEAPRGYFKAFIDGTTVDLRAFIAKTQFSIKRATYQIFDAQNNLLHTLPISGFYQNHSTKINLENYGNYRATFTIVDYRDQQVTITRPIPLVEETETLTPFVAFRAVQSNIRTLYLNLNQSFDYDENYSIREFIVNLGNGVTKSLTTDTFLTYVYPEAGTYTVSVTAKTNHGTEKTFSQSISITDNEVAPIMPDPTFAYRIYSFAQNVSFYNEKSGTPNGEIISYLWDFGDGTTATGETQAHFYMPGEYLVTLTVVDTAGYSSTQTQKISITATGDDIVANIDCTQRQPYLDITQMCKVNALDKFNEISRIRVVWGDGTVFTLATPFDPRQGVYYPQKAYTAEGTYSVRLIVNTARGAFKTHDISHTLTARRPVANIQCVANNLLAFCNGLASFDPKGTPLKYTFDFGNGHIESNYTGSISYAYPDAGLYLVRLIVEDAQGYTSSSSTNIQVVTPPNQLPIALLSCDSPAPRTVYCSDNGSEDLDGNIAIRKITFDDGQTAFVNPPDSVHHIFSSSGEHKILYTVIDEDGGETTVSTVIRVKENTAPIASFECSTPGPQRLNCYSTSTDSDPGDMPVKYNWSFGDNQSKEGLEGWFDHTYENSGEVSVKLIVEDQYGGISEVSKKYTTIENQAPVARISCDKKSLFELICSGATSSDGDGFIQSHRWLVGGQVINGASVQYSFTDGGIKKIELVVVDNLGRSSSSEFSINIQAPQANFECDIVNYTFNCQVQQVNGVEIDQLSYQFTFDNENIVRGHIAEHTFNISGEKVIHLEVTDMNGVTSKLQKKFFLQKKYLSPKPEFDYEADVYFKGVFNASESLRNERVVMKYLWSFGDGNTKESDSSVVEHSYLSSGFYQVRLAVVDDKGIEQSIEKRIYIYDAEVEYYDSLLDEELLGTDRDQDQVRDDVQRWISYEAKDNQEVKRLLKYMHKTINKILTSSVDSYDDLKNYEYAELCLERESSNFNLEQIGMIMKVMSLNTELRQKEWLRKISSVGGYESEALFETMDYDSYCSKINY